MNYLHRKKLAFMSIVNGVKGFIRNISGIPPLTLSACVDEDSLISYKIYGDSVQDGTPSLDNPIEIVSVGERTSNICPIDVSKWESGQWGITTPDKVVNNKRYRLIDLLPCEASTTYYVNSNVNSTFRAYSSDLSTGRNMGTISKGSFTTKENETFLGVFAFSDKYTTASAWKTAFQNGKIKLCISKDSNVLNEYEPYGYKIPVKARGKNLIKPVDGTYGKNNIGATVKDGQIIIHNIEPVIAGSTFTAYQIPCVFIQGEIGKTYTMCWGDGVKISNIGSSTLQIEFEDGTTKTLYGNWGASNAIKFTLTSLITKVLITIAVTDAGIYLDTPFTIQLEEGKVVTDYEPYIEPITTNIYLDEPLRKIGDYTDYIVFENRKVIRYINHIVFDGSENWTYANLNQQTERFVLDVKGVPNMALCNILPNNLNSWYSSEFCFHLNDNGVIRFYRPFYAGIIETTASLPNWKTFLADNFLQGSPIKAWYATENPVEQIIFLPKLPTFKGTTIYEIDTDVQTSNVAVSYYSSQKGE